MDKSSKSMNAFQSGLVNWGGWMKLTCAAPEALAEEISKTVETIGTHQQQRPPKVGQLRAEEWATIAETLPSFLNAYLQQELSRILEGSGDFITALRLVDDQLSGQLMMALIIVAREHFLRVEVCYTNPYGPEKHECACRLACENRSATLTIQLGIEHGEEHLPLVLYYHGEDRVWDKEESTPKNPVWVPVTVDRKAVIFTDGLEMGDRTKQQWSRDEFMTNQGFQPIRFSRGEVERDPFACAARAVELLTGKSLDKGKT
jgi:hypothetical protein